MSECSSRVNVLQGVSCVVVVVLSFAGRLMLGSLHSFLLFRDRADVLREEDPALQSIDWSVASLGQAMGTSDRIRREGGGVQASQSSVIANYFLKSHGGAHGLQCLCSALATLSGIAAIALNATKKKETAMIALTYTLLQRTFLFAMLKHVSGMLAAAAIAAKAIPKIGLSQSRQWMENLVLDPVSQYVFFNALMLLWLPKKARVIQGACWWWRMAGNWFIPVMLGPILIREVISNMLVISDVLVLWSVGGKDDTTSNSSSDGIETILKVSQSVINAVMSLLVTPDVWRSADPAKRQAILSKLVSRVSLFLEVAIGVMLFVDAVVGIFGAAFLSGTKRPSFVESLTRLICIRLYIHFLWVRRSKIKKLAFQVRGGASKLPIYVLDVLYEPGKALGIAKDNKTTKTLDEMTFWERLAVGLGFSD